MLNSSISAQERCEATDMVCKSGSYVLRRIVREVTHARHDTCKDDFLLKQFRKSWKSRAESSSIL
jgi:hypothetical protein